MWSRFARFARNSSSNMLKATSFVSMAEWIQRSDDKLWNVPTLDEVQTINASITSRDDNNLSYFDNDHDNMIKTYCGKFEDPELREILTYTPQIIEHIDTNHGMESKIVVDVGVGTGAFADALSESVGDNGAYIGLDISPSFIYHNDQKYKSKKNVRVNLSQCDSLDLPQQLKGHVDAFWICATYHHLSDTKAMLKEFYDYLRPGGKLVIVEFKKCDEGLCDHKHKHHGHDEQSKPYMKQQWINGHIPFTETEAKEEIIANGFVFEKYVLRQLWQYHFVHVYKKPSFN